MRRFFCTSFITILLGLISCNSYVGKKKQKYYPGKEWLQYSNPRSVGFNEHRINQAKNYCDSLNANSLLVIHKGKVLVNWGDNTRRMRTTSVRKSFLSALIGQKINEQELRLDQPLLEFNLPQLAVLDSTEKSATVEHLLTSSSGVYMPAAYEAEVWKKRKPNRGSHKPGEFWYYNNWDFNILGAIYNYLSEDSIANDFKRKIADPIGIKDFRPDLDFKYFYEKDISTPAYLFKMSTRDMARFGLLYLRNGKWKDNQIIPKNWIKESTAHKQTPWDNTGYGFLWWNKKLNDGSYTYYANGAMGQGIYVVPSKDLVMVFRADTFTGPELDGQEMKVLEMICEAYDDTFEASSNPNTFPTKWNESPTFLEDYRKKQWVGKYSNNLTRQLEIKLKGNRLILETKIADFLMFPESDSTAWVEDLNIKAFLKSSNSLSGTSQLNKKGLIIYK